MNIGWPFARRHAVTLVIDDGPSDVTPQLLSLLERGGHRAVLFVLGCNVAGREQVLIDALRRGFALGNHSFGHPYFSAISLDEARTEIEATETLIDAAYAGAGVRRRARWFRFPYLDTGLETGEREFEDLQALLGEFGFERPSAVGRRLASEDKARLDWPTTLNTEDWALPDEGALRLALRGAKAGDVIEFHDKSETVGRYGTALVEELAALSLRAVVPGRGLGGFG